MPATPICKSHLLFRAECGSLLFMHSALFLCIHCQAAGIPIATPTAAPCSREIRDLGFEYAELSHGIRISLLPGIIEAVDAGEIKISTLHNFCPLPIGVNHAAPNLFKFTALDARERENAHRHTLKTLETAARLKAQLVVLHMGCVEMKDYTDRFSTCSVKAAKTIPKYQKLCLEAEEKREAEKEKHISSPEKCSSAS